MDLREVLAAALWKWLEEDLPEGTPSWMLLDAADACLALLRESDVQDEFERRVEQACGDIQAELMFDHLPVTYAATAARRVFSDMLGGGP